MALDAGVRQRRYQGPGGRRGADDDHQLRGPEGAGVRACRRQGSCPARRAGAWSGSGWPWGRCAARSPPRPPLLGPEDWKGARFRVYNSPVQADAVRALGGTPANLGFGWVDEVHARKPPRRRVRHRPVRASNGYSTEAGHVTANVVLWPKVFVLSLSQKRLTRLPSSSRRGCARQPSRPSRHQSTPLTTRPLRHDLVREGCPVPGGQPRPDQGLRSVLRPVLDRLAADLASGQLLRESRRSPRNTRQPEVPTVPAAADRGPPTSPASARSRRGVRTSRRASTASRSPTTTLRRQVLTIRDWAGTWTLTVRTGATSWLPSAAARAAILRTRSVEDGPSRPATSGAPATPCTSSTTPNCCRG